MHHERRSVWVALATTACTVVVGSASGADDTECEQQTFEVGVEAYVYGYPLVLMDVTRRVMTNVPSPRLMAAPVNQFAHVPRFPDPESRSVVSPNADMLQRVRLARTLPKNPSSCTSPTRGPLLPTGRCATPDKQSSAWRGARRQQRMKATSPSSASWRAGQVAECRQGDQGTDQHGVDSRSHPDSSTPGLQTATNGCAIRRDEAISDLGPSGCRTGSVPLRGNLDLRWDSGELAGALTIVGVSSNPMLLIFPMWIVTCLEREPLQRVVRRLPASVTFNGSGLVFGILTETLAALNNLHLPPERRILLSPDPLHDLFLGVFFDLMLIAPWCLLVRAFTYSKTEVFVITGHDPGADRLATLTDGEPAPGLQGDRLVAAHARLAGFGTARWPSRPDVAPVCSPTRGNTGSASRTASGRSSTPCRCRITVGWSSSFVTSTSSLHRQQTGSNGSDGAVSSV